MNIGLIDNMIALSRAVGSTQKDKNGLELWRKKSDSGHELQGSFGTNTRSRTGLTTIQSNMSDQECFKQGSGILATTCLEKEVSVQTS